MVGGFTFKLVSNKLQYELEVQRKITKVIGDSATGKSELVAAIVARNDPMLAIQIACKADVYAITESFIAETQKDIRLLCEKIHNHKSKEFQEEMRSLLSRYDQRLYFCDETFPYLFTDEFALFCKYTDSFFIIFCRAKLVGIPYSYREIYRVKASGKYHTFERVYEEYTKFPLISKSSYALLEDSGSGMDFYSAAIFCESAHGKSNLPILMKQNEQKWSVVIADGAAIGSEIADILAFKGDMELFLPESFEYILLSSKMFSEMGIDDQLYHTEKYATGLDFSWEQYYTDLILSLTKGKKYQYQKRKLNPCYFEKCCVDPECRLVKMSDKFAGIIKLRQ